MEPQDKRGVCPNLPRSPAAANQREREPIMSFVLMGRRRGLQMAVGLAVLASPRRRAGADPAAIAPIRQLCDSLLGIMRAGRGTPFARRFETLTPAIEHAFDLTAILQLSVGPSWGNLQPGDQN